MTLAAAVQQAPPAGDGLSARPPSSAAPRHAMSSQTQPADR